MEVKRETNKQELTEGWGSETESGAACLGSTTWIWIVTATASGCERSGTCCGFWKESEPHQMHQAPQQGPGFHAQPCRSFPHLQVPEIHLNAPYLD